jgi:DNA/RNA-binding domain of Phe-tRNA-synthetase-like protein
MTGAFREKIDMAVFGARPGFIRRSFRILLPEAPEPEAAAAALSAASERASKALRDDDARLLAWRDVYRDIGLSEATVSPAEILLAWARHPGGVPSQGALRDMVNAFMLDHALPAAAYDLESFQGDLWLRPSRGCEIYLAPGEQRPETPEINELILVDSSDLVLARDWHGRLAGTAAAGASTQQVLVHLDLLDMQEADEDSLVEDFESRTRRLLGASTESRRLSWETPEAQWSGSEAGSEAGTEAGMGTEAGREAGPEAETEAGTETETQA